MYRDWAAIQHAKAIKLNKVADTFPIKVRDDLSFIDILKDLSSYAPAISLRYGVHVGVYKHHVHYRRQDVENVPAYPHFCFLRPLRPARQSWC